MAVKNCLKLKNAVSVTTSITSRSALQLGLQVTYAQYTPPTRRRDSTVELSRVGGVNAPVGNRDPLYNFLCCWAIEVGDKWRHNDVILEKLTNIDQNSRTVKPLSSVSRLTTESAGSRREIVANCVHTVTPPTPTRRNSTVASRRRCVVGFMDT